MGGVIKDDLTCKPYPNGIPNWAFVQNDFDTWRVGGYFYPFSFDWLMPVVSKINQICDEMEKKYPETKTGNLDEYTTWRSWSYHRVEPELEIENLYINTIEFIKWYNEYKK